MRVAATIIGAGAAACVGDTFTSLPAILIWGCLNGH